jgi:hypothetical protein
VVEVFSDYILVFVFRLLYSSNFFGVVVGLSFLKKKRVTCYDSKSINGSHLGASVICFVLTQCSTQSVTRPPQLKEYTVNPLC